MADHSEACGYTVADMTCESNEWTKKDKVRRKTLMLF